MSGGSIASSLFGSFGQPGAPGFVPPTVNAPVNAAAAGGANAMVNRYNQLGLAPQGATPTTPGGGGFTTPEAMDLGALPSYGGGIAGEGNAVLGGLQNQALQSPNLGKSTSPASIIGTIGRII